MAGRINKKDSNQWEYFPTSNANHMTRQERESHNEGIFTCLEDMMDSVPIDEEDNTIQSESTYQLIDVVKLQDIINEQCVCS